MTSDRLQVGQILAERFQIDELIGEGGMGTIYRAHHVKLPREFALKILKPALAGDPAFVKRFLREAVAASRIIHPNVVNVTDFGQLPDGNYYIAMEHLKGISLDQEVDRLGSLPLGRAVEILVQLADALDYCHAQGIVHRDLKTENVLLCTIRGRRDVVKLVDFGIARMLGPEVNTWLVTQQGMIFGTPEYLSPEQALDRDLDGRADLYALGIIAFELVTGAPPFTGKYTEVLKAHVQKTPPAPSSLAREAIPPAYDALVANLLAKDPANRFQTGGEVLTELLRLRGQLTGQISGSPTGAAGGPASAPAKGQSAPRKGSAPRIATEGAWASLSDRRASPAGDAPPSRTLAPGAAPSREDLVATLRTALAAEEVIRQREIVLKELAYSLHTRGADAAGLGETLNEILRLEQELRGAAEELDLLAQQRAEHRLEAAEQSRALRLLLQDAELRSLPGPASPEAAAAATQARRLRTHLDTLLQAADETRSSLAAAEESSRARQREREIAIAQRYALVLAGTAPGRAQATDRERRLYERLEHLEAMLAHARDAVR